MRSITLLASELRDGTRASVLALNHTGSASAMSVVFTHGVNEPTVLEEREGCALPITILSIRMEYNRAIFFV